MIQVVRTVVQHDSTNARTSLCRSKMNETNKYFIQTIRETGVNVGKFNKITKCQKLTCRIREFQRLRELREGSEIFPVVPGPCSIAFWLSSSFPTRFCCWLSSAGSWRRRWWRQRRREQNPACGGGGYALAAGTFSFFFFLPATNENVARSKSIEKKKNEIQTKSNTPTTLEANVAPEQKRIAAGGCVQH